MFLHRRITASKNVAENLESVWKSKEKGLKRIITSRKNFDKNKTKRQQENSNNNIKKKKNKNINNNKTKQNKQNIN